MLISVLSNEAVLGFAYLNWTAVNVSVVFRHEVDVVEDEALIVVLLQRLGCTNIEEHGSVESLGPVLLNNVDAIVKLLSGK